MENTSEAPKRRGRPPGSKNKKTRKPVTNPSEITIHRNGMGLHLNTLEVPAGRDIIAAVYDFTNRHQLGGVSVTSTYGLVRNVTLYHPNMPTPLYKYKDVHWLLYLMGNFYGSPSFIRPWSPFPTRHFVSLECGRGIPYMGSVQGKLTAASNVLLSLSFIKGTESIKLPLTPAIPAPQYFFYLNRGIRTVTGGLLLDVGSSMSAAGGLLSGVGGSVSAADGLFSCTGGSISAADGLLSGAGGSRSPAGGLLSGAEGSMSAADGLLSYAGGSISAADDLLSGAGGSRSPAGCLLSGAEGSMSDGMLSGAGGSISAVDGLLSGAGGSMSATAALTEFSSGAGLPEFSSGAGWSGQPMVVL
ncbi:uncharacterized protein LOC143589621 [Bidens hawaiensis]|uniref:uncharacterized protein LOC143589621 n=1 Tax=Bidens hawaiensis TaxID=980011 RepID=UPI00404A5EBC